MSNENKKFMKGQDGEYYEAKKIKRGSLIDRLNLDEEKGAYFGGLNATRDEMADSLGCTARQLRTLFENFGDSDFVVAFRRAKAQMKLNIKSRQIELSNDATNKFQGSMLVHLGKVICGQAETSNHNIEVEKKKADLSALSDEELKTLERTLSKTIPEDDLED